MHTVASSSSHLFSCETLRNLIPSFPPAVKADSCEVDLGLLNARMKKAVFRIFAITTTMLLAAAAAIFIFPPAAVIAIPTVSVFANAIVGAINIWDARFRSPHAVNLKAVNEYLAVNSPSYSASMWLASHLNALKLLKEKGGDLNRLDATRRSLLATASNNRQFEAFKFLADNKANFSASTAELSYFIRYSEDKFFAYAYKKRIVGPVNFLSLSIEACQIMTDRTLAMIRNPALILATSREANR